MGRSRGGLTTKIHMAVDALGRPLKLILTPGQRGDAPLAPALLQGLSPRRVLADKAYDSNALRGLIDNMGRSRHPLQPDPQEANPLRFRPTRSETPSSDASISSSTSDASQPAGTGAPYTSSASYNSPPQCCGCAECQFSLLALLSIGGTLSDRCQRLACPSPIEWSGLNLNA